jgi:hypothetical protein
MTDLSRSLLTAAREGLAPDPAIAARVKARVAATVAASAAATTATTTTTVAATTKTTGSASLVFKLGAALLAVGVVATTAVVLHERRPEAPHLVVDTTDEPDAPRAAERVTSHDEAPARAPTVRKAKAGGAVDRAASELDEPASLSREVELLDRAMKSLGSGSPAAALASLATFERETFGRGQMAEEAAAIALEARCMLGEDVSARLAAFDRRWPSYAQRARITAACRR